MAAPATAAVQQAACAFDASAPTAGFDAGGNSSFHAYSKPGAAGTAGAGAIISLTATSTHPRSGSGSPTALPAHLLTEPTLPAPAYGSAAAWGTHLAGAAFDEAPSATGNPFGGAAAAALASAAPAADAPFSDFSPFK
jgi:hypothetical protein